MNRAEFLSYKSTFVNAARSVLAVERSDVLAEAAFPAYANPNPLMSFLFWERIRRVILHLEGTRATLPRVLDFGCGGGVMLPFLGRISGDVVAMDIDLSPNAKMAAHVRFPPNIEYLDARDTPLTSLPSEAFDVTVALDVLEHVPDLEVTLAELVRTLAPGGEIIVSGPAENLAYRIGRGVAGEEYSGDYHVRDVYQIRDLLARLTTVNTLATLFYPIPLFKIYVAKKAVS